MKLVTRDILLWVGLATVVVMVVAVVSGGDDAPAEPPAAESAPAAVADGGAPAGGDGGQGGGNFDYWLERAAPADGETDETPDQQDDPADDEAGALGADEAAGEADSQGPIAPADWALPGVIELSDGTVIAGMLWTAGDEPLEVYVEAEKRWRRVPLAAALSITAVVVEERMENVWRWKGTGEDEKVYTGEQYPFRRFEWTVTIADGSEITGVIKGQAIRVAALAGPSNIRILPERTKGEVGQSLDDLIHVQRIIISREAMEAIPPDEPIDPQHGVFVH